MANIAITQGSGTLMATDTVIHGGQSNVNIQKLKLTFGSDGSYTDVTTTSGYPTQLVDDSGLPTIQPGKVDSVTTNSIKSSAGVIYGGYFMNVTTATRWLAFYNVAGTPSLTGTPDVPIRQFAIGAGAPFWLPIGRRPWKHSTGIGIAAKQGVANNATVAGANEITGTLDYI